MALDLTKGACKFVIKKYFISQKKKKGGKFNVNFPKDAEFHVGILP